MPAAVVTTASQPARPVRPMNWPIPELVAWSHCTRGARAGMAAGLLPVEVKADVGLTQQAGPLGPLRSGQGRGRAMMVAWVARLWQQVRPVADLDARMSRDARHLLLFEERADQDADIGVHATTDRIASDIWKALKR